MVAAGTASSRDREDLLAGETIAGRFRVEEKLGSGGMGVVFAATDLAGNRRVALKFLRWPLGRASVERFVREARAAAALVNPHVTRVLDVGETSCVFALLPSPTVTPGVRSHKRRRSAARAWVAPRMRTPPRLGGREVETSAWVAS